MMRYAWFWIMLAALHASAGTVSGTLMGPSGLPIKNGTLTFVLQQAGLLIGSGSVVPVTASCYTSTDGTVVGLPNPVALPSVAVSYGTGTLPGGTYYVEIGFRDAAGNTTLASPELLVLMTGTGSLLVAPPAAFPANAVGMTVFIGSTSGGETAQGTTTGATHSFTQSGPLAAGIAAGLSNTSLCGIAFNDTIIPFSGYNVSLLSSSGNAYPGWPQAWQLNGGLNGTVNVSNGAPLWNGTVIYPMPILAQPLNHGPQSIAGLLNMSVYNVVNVGRVGIGTSTPGWPLDVENGAINSNLGYLVNGSAGSSGQCLVSNGSFFGPGSCGSLPALFYQYAQANGTILPQQGMLNFAPRLTAVNNAAALRTDVDLATTGVTAGSYANANFTVDAYGRVTGATNGVATPVVQALIINSGICTTGNTAFATCTMGATWPVAFANAAYAVSCTAASPSGVALNTIYFSGKTASGFVLTLQNADASGANAVSVAEIDCLGLHP